MNPLKKTLVGGVIVGTTLTAGVLGAVAIEGTASAQTATTHTSTTHTHQQGGRHGRGGVAGTVTSISGADFTVTVPARRSASAGSATAARTLTVDTTGSTTFTQVTASSVAAITPGETIAARGAGPSGAPTSGSTSSPTSLAASRITIEPATTSSRHPRRGVYGTVVTNSDGTLTVLTASGTTDTVTTTPSTMVDQVTPATLTDVAVGDEVAVRGASGDESTATVTAQRVQLLPPGTKLGSSGGSPGAGSRGFGHHSGTEVGG